MFNQPSKMKTDPTYRNFPVTKGELSFLSGLLYCKELTHFLYSITSITNRTLHFVPSTEVPLVPVFKTE